MKSIFAIILISSVLFGDVLIQRLDRLIKNKRTKSIVVLKYDPFFTKKEIQKAYFKDAVAKKKVLVPVKKRLELVSILGKKAFVGNRWVGKNDTIDGYKVKKVSNNRLILVKKGKLLILRFKKSKEILKVKEK